MAGTKDWKGGVTHWLPVEHRQIIALVRDLTERLDRLPVETSERRNVSLADVHRQGLDAILGQVMAHGDRARAIAEQAPATTRVIGPFWVAVCDTCSFLNGGEQLEMPFGSADDRAAWCRAHSEGTGHDKWSGWEVPAKLARD